MIGVTCTMGRLTSSSSQASGSRNGDYHYHRHNLTGMTTRSTRTHVALAGLLAMLMLLSATTFACNIDTREPYTAFTPEQHGQPGSYFGYTVLQHYNNRLWRLVIGAPRGTSSTYGANSQNAGAIWQCRATATRTYCDEVSIELPRGTTTTTLRNAGIVDNADNSWMGVSLARQSNRLLADVTVCAHRHGNDIALQGSGLDYTDPKVDRYIQGLCYTLEPELEETMARFNPCAGLDAWRDGVVVNNSMRWQGWCQFGSSATYTIEEEETEAQSLYVGALGSFDWTGTTFKQELNGQDEYTEEMINGDLSSWVEDYTETDFYQYVGYATSVGHFMSTSSQEGATGAPRAGGLVGKVYIHDLKNFTVFQELHGEMMNTYFGGAVEALDINNDGLYDLLVGAPLYSTDMDEGRVYVYMNRGGSSPLQLHQSIDGTTTPGSRFGHIITSIGDLGKDDYTDVAIGAPYEDGGIVYIYQCTEHGIDLAPSQLIRGRDIDPTIESFGSAISGGHDFDSSGYPDIAIGAYANDSVYLYKTRPILDLLVNLTVTPDPMDPENPACRDEQGVCLKIQVCFNYEGPSPGALPGDIEVIFDLELDHVKTAEGLKPRFLIDNNGTMDAIMNTTETIFRFVNTCFNYTAYLQTTATDFLTAMPVDLTYILMDYPVEPPARGDSSNRFPDGLSPVMKSYQCAAVVKSEDVNFVSDCGEDGICSTDIRLKGDIEIEGNPSVIIVGGPSQLYINARVENVGEEAHQAYLVINHPIDVRYEGLEINEVSCISSDGSDDVSGDCHTGQVLVTCEPKQVNFDTSTVSCYLGNPMESFTASTLRLRFDIGGLIWATDRDIPISMTASTNSEEDPATVADNEMTITYQLAVEADLGVFGTATPESVYYSSNSSRYATAEAVKKSLQAAVDASLTDPSSPSFNETHIGAPFTLSYKLTNEGVGRLPFQSVLTINIPWRMVDGDWLVFIKSITVSDTTGTGSCNGDEILALQNKRLLEFYVDMAPSLRQDVAEEITRIFDDVEKSQEMGCSKAKCVALTCFINPLQARQILEVRIEAVQWEYTLITRELGYVELLTEAGVVSQMSSEHGQGDNTSPDRIKLPIKMFTDMTGAGTVPIWVIIVSIIGGLILLLLLILLLWKCGFFKRKTRQDWEKETDGPTSAAPMPIKPPMAPDGELDGSDLPMMKGLASQD